MNAESFTVGVEEEFHVVDAETLGLRESSEPVRALVHEDLGEQVQPELVASAVEVETPVCDTLDQVRHHLQRLRGQLDEAARAQGSRILASGTHPFSSWEGQAITPKPRYLKLAEDFRQLAREQLVCGCHVHVCVQDRDIAVRIMDRTRPWLAVLLALTANSPYWEGTDTGYASFRTEVFDRWPTTGTPLPLGSCSAFDALVESMLASGVIRDAGALYWDVRPSARYSTLEFRVADVCTTVDETVMLAGLVRSLVRTCHGQAVRDEPVDQPRSELVRLARWRAARHGLEGELVDLAGPGPVPARVMVERLVGLLRDDLEDHGEWDEVSALVEHQLHQGTGARRQREAAARDGGVRAVPAYLVERSVAP